MISMLLQSVLETEESSGDVLAVVIFQFHLSFAHRKKLYCFILCSTGIKRA